MAPVEIVRVGLVGVAVIISTINFFFSKEIF
jgi:hypothetical protein